MRNFDNFRYTIKHFEVIKITRGVKEMYICVLIIYRSTSKLNKQCVSYNILTEVINDLEQKMFLTFFIKLSQTTSRFANVFNITESSIHIS